VTPLKKIIPVIMFVLFLAACSNPTTKNTILSQPPNAYGTIQGQKIPFILGSYHWNNTIADAPAPPELIRNEIKQIEQPGDIQIDFETNKKPKKVVVAEWSNGDARYAVAIQNRIYRVQ
jgi:hypothetical protein